MRLPLIVYLAIVRYSVTYRPELFARDDCFAGANFSAATTVDASVGIDFVDVAFRD